MLSIDQKTKGAWVVHHANKLETTKSPQFEDIELAGKCGNFLAVLYESEETRVNKVGVGVLANLAQVSKIELPTVLEILKKKRLIDLSAAGDVAAIGLTTTAILGHTADIFDNQKPSAEQLASIFIAERASEKPQELISLAEEVSDTFKLSKLQTNETLALNEAIGFIDAEPLEGKNKLLFNGNLFKFDNAVKTKKILDSLTGDEQSKVIEIQGFIQENACITVDEAIKIIGEKLFQKLNAIGMFDLNLVSNPQDAVRYITNPASFAKFAPTSSAGDTFDMAKALVSSLKYGMSRRHSSRGRIMALSALLDKLVSGRWVGSATAIGQDYKVLEMNRVIKTKPDPDKRNCYLMKLLKKDVGDLAKTVLLTGDEVESAATTLVSASVTGYTGPEKNRVTSRKIIKDSGDKLVEQLRTML